MRKTLRFSSGKDPINVPLNMGVIVKIVHKGDYEDKRSLAKLIEWLVIKHKDA